MSEPIKPRTRSERNALSYGYAMAVNDIKKHGLSFAVEQVRIMAVTDGLFADAAAAAKEIKERRA